MQHRSFPRLRREGTPLNGRGLPGGLRVGGPNGGILPSKPPSCCISPWATHSPARAASACGTPGADLLAILLAQPAAASRRQCRTKTGPFAKPWRSKWPRSHTKPRISTLKLMSPVDQQEMPWPASIQALHSTLVLLCLRLISAFMPSIKPRS